MKSSKQAILLILLVAIVAASVIAQMWPEKRTTAAASVSARVPLPRVYTGFPEKLDPACRDGKARMFDQCSDQRALFDAALARAASEQKVLLVEVGAEWCIWCHVFEAHINGEYDRFEYTYDGSDDPDAHFDVTFEEERQWVDPEAAKLLREFVAANFVVVHIDIEHAPNSAAVFEAAGVKRPPGIPLVFSVDGSGRFAAKFDHDSAERRRDEALNWYRGYDRRSLLRQLTSMRDAARVVNATPPTR